MDFVSHKECRLGKWYGHGHGKEAFSHVPSYAVFDKLDRIMREKKDNE